MQTYPNESGNEVNPHPLAKAVLDALARLGIRPSPLNGIPPLAAAPEPHRGPGGRPTSTHIRPGDRFGRLVVVAFAGMSQHGHAKYLSRCDCGNEKIVYRSVLLKRTGTRSCGCWRLEQVRGGAAKRRQNLVGRKFGRLLVVERADPSRYRRSWLCQCSCGNKKIIRAECLTRGSTRSCGCLQRELAANRRRTHGHCAGRGGGRRNKHTAEYRCWTNIKTRCTNPKSIGWKDYGGRGIRVCDRWLHSFENFLSDMGRKPSPRHTIDRIDNDGPYSPENCRWALPKEQRANQRPCSRISGTGFVGVVRRSRGKYHARIIVAGAYRNLGTFPTVDEAARAYDAAARELRPGGRIRTNFPQGGELPARSNAEAA